jgi:hypothetical protein
VYDISANLASLTGQITCGPGDGEMLLRSYGFVGTTASFGEPGLAAMGTLGVPIGCPAGRGHGWPAVPIASCKGRGICPSCNGRHMTQTAAHLVDHVISPVPVRQWVISVPKRLRGMLADRPRAVAVLTKIFLTEIERLRCGAACINEAANTQSASRPRLGGISFLHRFGSALNHHVHLHACVTDGVFVPAADHTGRDALPTFLPARPATAASCGGRLFPQPARLVSGINSTAVPALPRRSSSSSSGRSLLSQAGW